MLTHGRSRPGDMKATWKGPRTLLSVRVPDELVAVIEQRAAAGGWPMNDVMVQVLGEGLGVPVPAPVPSPTVFHEAFCGTVRGYRQHGRFRTTPCPPCLAAEAARVQARRARKAAAADAQAAVHEEGQTVTAA